MSTIQKFKSEVELDKHIEEIKEKCAYIKSEVEDMEDIEELSDETIDNFACKDFGDLEMYPATKNLVHYAKIFADSDFESTDALIDYMSSFAILRSSFSRSMSIACRRAYDMTENLSSSCTAKFVDAAIENVDAMVAPVLQAVNGRLLDGKYTIYSLYSKGDSPYDTYSASAGETSVRLSIFDSNHVTATIDFSEQKDVSAEYKAVRDRLQSMIKDAASQEAAYKASKEINFVLPEDSNDQFGDNRWDMSGQF